MNEHIHTLDQAKLIALDWAAENKKDLSSSVRYAEKWFEETAEIHRFKKILLLSLDIFQREKENSQKYWNESAEKNWQRNSEWTLETVKHLAFINGASMAGCAALFASSSPSSIYISMSLILFSIGLILAVSDFYLCSLGYEKRANKYQNISIEIQKVSYGSEVNDIFNKSSFNKEKEFICASRCGWASISFALAGIFFIALHLCKNV